MSLFAKKKTSFQSQKQLPPKFHTKYRNTSSLPYLGNIPKKKYHFFGASLSQFTLQHLSPLGSFVPLTMFDANLDGNEDINLLIVVYLIFGRINVENEQIGRGI